ncbi:DNA repair protein RecO [bacterium]|nr:DNA repair protein RecO [candidate division CSSED10-310 bacterium]
MHTQAVSVQGLVLRRSPLGESDQIFTLFTYELGKIKAAARGSLKPKNPLRGILEPFHQVQAHLVHSDRSSLYRFQSAEVIGRPSTFLNHLTALHTAYLVLECLDRYCEPENANPELYEATIAALGQVNREPDRAGYFIRCFCFRFFTLSGYAMDWHHCARCNRQRPPDRSAFCLPAAGGVVCSSCASPDEARKEWIVESDVLALASRAAAGESIRSETVDQQTESIFERRSDRLIREIFSHYLDGIPRSLLMMEKLETSPDGENSE